MPRKSRPLPLRRARSVVLRRGSRPCVTRVKTCVSKRGDVAAKAIKAKDTAIKALKPEAKDYELAVGDEGLRLRVTTTGRKVFRWRYRKVQPKAGKPQWGVKTLGTYSKAFGLADARNKLDKLKAAHKQALETGHEEAPIATVSELADEFFKRRIEKQRKRPDEALRILDKDIKPGIGKYKFDTITTPTIGKMITGIVDKGSASHAGKVLALTKQMFSYAESLGYITHSPASSLKADNLGVEANTRDRYLTASEIREFWFAMDKMPRMSESVKLAFKVLLLTGVRSGELLKAMWANVDLDKGEWTIPAEDQKLTPKQAQTAQPFVIPLPSLAVGLFTQLKKIAGKNPHVMASPIAESGRYDDKSLGHALRRMKAYKTGEGDKVLDLPHFTAHDLRRTLRTHLADTLNVQPHVAEKVLNHSLGRIEGIYNRADLYVQRRDALERWAKFIDRLIHGGKIVELRA